MTKSDFIQLMNSLDAGAENTSVREMLAMTDEEIYMDMLECGEDWITAYPKHDVLTAVNFWRRKNE